MSRRVPPPPKVPFVSVLVTAVANGWEVTAPPPGVGDFVSKADNVYAFESWHSLREWLKLNLENNEQHHEPIDHPVDP